MIRADGDLSFRSSNAAVRIFREEQQLVCELTNWPHPLRPRLGFGKFLPDGIAHEPVTIRFNQSYLGTIRQGKLSRLNLWTALKAYFSYLISRIRS